MGQKDFIFFVAQTFYRLTDLARSMAKYPVAPAFAKMLCIGNQRNLLPYVVIIVAALSVQEVFIETFLPADNNQEVCIEEELCLYKLIDFSADLKAIPYAVCFVLKKYHQLR